MELSNYYDFAENDYQFFMAAYRDHLLGNSMAAIAQNTCERYLKHLVQELYFPESAVDSHKKQDVLRTHSLRRLLRFLEEMGYTYSAEAKSAMLGIDGFYFSTRYPGDESITVRQEDIEECKSALELCKKETDVWLQDRLA